MRSLPKWMLAGVLATSLAAIPSAARPNDNPKDATSKDDAKDPKLDPVPSYDKVKKGSLDDVNAIGNREIGGKGLGNWYSLEKEVAMGSNMPNRWNRAPS